MAVRRLICHSSKRWSRLGAVGSADVGPGSAKTEFAHHLDRRHPQLAAHVVAVETVDHPSDHELLDFARRTFTRIDSLRGTIR